MLDAVSDGRTVAVRWCATATQVGTWGPVAPTGRTVTWEGAHFFTVGPENLIVGVWALGDPFAKARQLGALPGG